MRHLGASRPIPVVFLQEYDTSTSMYPAAVTAAKDQTSTHIESSTYLHLLGKLMYLVNSRPDISTALSYAATKSHCPKQHDFESLLKVVAYLKQTHDYGLTLRANPNPTTDSSMNIVAYVDASFMNHQDTASHTGYTISLGPVHPTSYF